mgnify:CR=1 FL=1
MKIKKVAELTGVSVRTLHYYDDIGLLTPEEKTASGYRLYSDRDLDRLQQILLYKELGFSLKKIKEIMKQPSFHYEQALEEQREMLVEKRKRLDQMISLVDQTLRHVKGEQTMTNEEKFKGFDFSENRYEEEARDRWGDEAVERSNEKLGNLSAKQKSTLEKQMNDVYRELAAIRHTDPSSDEAQAAIGKWYTLLNRMGSYSLDAFKGLGQMYIEDERFTKNIDQFGDGLALFMRDAMADYADRKKRR